MAVTIFTYMAIVITASSIVLTSSEPMVEVEQGRLLGITERFTDEFLKVDKDIDIFLGVPYAEPPLGERRFSSPVPKASWSDDLYNATYQRAICMQYQFEALFFEVSEDCLFLNIFVPNPAPTSAPVMVFIHGGGYDVGNGYLHMGVPLAAVGDVIVVLINYRLGPFGYLTTGDGASPGSYGMLDQAEALKWIQSNIHAFGGDNNQVTLFGESAGASSVSAHLFSNNSRHLFKQAILQSGSIFSPWAFHHDVEEQRKRSFELGVEVGCLESDSTALLACLRRVRAPVLNKAAYDISYSGAPVVDGTFFTESPFTMLANNDFKKCALMTGVNLDEGTLFVLLNYDYFTYVNSSVPPFISEETFDGALDSLLSGYQNNMIVDSVKQQYVNWEEVDDPNADYIDAYSNFYGDENFVCPSDLELRTHVDSGHEMYKYLFTHVPSVSIYTNVEFGPKWLGAAHMEELQFVFGYPFYPPPQLRTHVYPDTERQLSQRMMVYWSNFARTSNPNLESASTQPYEDERAWPTFTIPSMKHKELAVTLSDGEAFKANQCHFWNEYLPQISSFTADLSETERQWREEFYTWKYEDMESWRDEFEKYLDDTTV